MERFWVIFCLQCYFFTGFGQVNVAVTMQSPKDSIQVGESFPVEISLEIKKAVPGLLLDFSAWQGAKNTIYPTDTLFYSQNVAIEVQNSGSWSSFQVDQLLNLASVMSGKSFPLTIKNTLTLAIFESGRIEIPLPTVSGIDSTQVGYGQPAYIHVLNPIDRQALDTAAVRPLRDIHREPAHWTDYSMLIGILVFLILAGLAYYGWKKRKRSVKTETMIPQAVLPPGEQALQSLQRLREKHLWEEGKIKEYQAELTEIIRIYLEGRYSIAAVEMTTDEILDALPASGVSVHHLMEVKQILQVADMVKFALATPESNIHELFMQRAIAFVNETTSSSS